MRQFLDELDGIRQPPFGNVLRQMRGDVLRRDARAGLADHQKERALVPFRVMYADRGRFDDAEKIAREGLSDAEASANVGYLRQMLAQQKDWKKTGAKPFVPQPNPGG